MMNRRHMVALNVCILMLLMGTSGYSGKKSDNQDICDPKIILQIQEGQSTKDDVKQLIGEPQKMEALFNDQEVWKYKYSVSAHSGSGRQSGFGSSGQNRAKDSSSFSTGKKNCNLHVVFEKNAVVKKVRKSNVSGSAFMGN